MLKSQEQLESGLVSVIPSDPTDFLSTVIFVDGCNLGSKRSEIPSLRCLLGDLGVAHCVCFCFVCPDVMNETCPGARALSTSFSWITLQTSAEVQSSGCLPVDSSYGGEGGS